jgi:hypothetical protein
VWVASVNHARAKTQRVLTLPKTKMNTHDTFDVYTMYMWEEVGVEWAWRLDLYSKCLLDMGAQLYLFFCTCTSIVYPLQGLCTHYYDLGTSVPSTDEQCILVFTQLEIYYY